MIQKEILIKVAENAYLLENKFKTTPKELSSRKISNKLATLRLFYIKLCVLEGYSISSSAYLINRLGQGYLRRLKRLDKIGTLKHQFENFKSICYEQ